MQIVHRLSIASTPTIQSELSALGIAVDSSGLATFEVDEAKNLWPQIEAWIEQRGPVDVITTKFSKGEISSSEWLELAPDWHRGYPEPDSDNFGYLGTTYDGTSRCNSCGIGLVQIAPFRMATEPKWGRNSVLQLYWVYDEFFVTRSLWSSVFQARGIECSPVLDSSGHHQLANVVQLNVESKVSIDTHDLTALRCKVCERVKYLPAVRGEFPAVREQPREPMVKTQEYFGSGASAANRVLVSQDLARALTNEKVRGASFRPVQRRLG